MSDWERKERRATRDEAKALALELMEKQCRPMLVGEVALACGALWSLEDAERLLEDLFMENLVVKIVEKIGSLVRYERARPSGVEPV
jgi:hypothetical protein